MLDWALCVEGLVLRGCKRGCAECQALTGGCGSTPSNSSSLCTNMCVICKLVMLMPCVLTPLSPLCLQGQSVVLVGHPSRRELLRQRRAGECRLCCARQPTCMLLLKSEEILNDPLLSFPVLADHLACRPVLHSAQHLE